MSQPTILAAARRHTRRGFGATVLAAALAACGGGGGGDSAEPSLVQPPSTVATLVQSDAEAMASVQALNANAVLLLKKSSALDGGSLFAPVGAAGSPLNLRDALARASRERALARETVGCAQLGLTSCSGSVTFDSNFEGSGDVLPAGTYLAMTFNSLSGAAEGSAFSMSGGFRMDFLTALNVNTTSFANVRFQITLSDLSGTVDGVSFGPDTAVALYEFDAQGLPSVTIDGLRIRGLANLTADDDRNYRLNAVDVRMPHWTNAANFVDADYSNWAVSAGRPVAQSTATISAGTNSMAIVVLDSSQSQVVYGVALTVNGAVVNYRVTANYSNDVPSYTVTLVAT